ncbi:hypothetical protein [Longispora urticae]
MSERVVRPPAERTAGLGRVVEARATTTSADRLRALARDEVRPVRVWAARNLNTPPDALDLLTRDPDEIVQWNALLHPRTPAPALERLTEDENRRYGGRWFVIRDRVVHHPNTPEPLRESLYRAGACATCSPTCDGWRVYTRRHTWQANYRPAGLFRRTDAQRADQALSWHRDDQAFFAAGACHILAWAFLAAHPDSGFGIRALRAPGEAHPFHCYVSDGRWAFDHCGWTLETELDEAYRAEVMTVTSSLEEFCAEHRHRLPERFFELPWARAEAYVARYR